MNPYPKTAITWWVSSNQLWDLVTTNNGKVIASGTATRQFVGHDFDKLKQWLHKQGGLSVRRFSTNTY